MRDQGSQGQRGGRVCERPGISGQWWGVGIQDTRGLITGEVGLNKIPGVSSLGRGGGGYMKEPSPQHARVGP